MRTACNKQTAASWRNPISGFCMKIPTRYADVKPNLAVAVVVEDGHAVVAQELVMLPAVRGEGLKRCWPRR
jgi:hypothetical protein